MSDLQFLDLLLRGKRRATSLDLRSCFALTEDGIASALSGQLRLRNLDVRCTQLSSLALVTALRGRHLLSLKAHGVITSDCPLEAAIQVAALRLICPAVAVSTSCTTMNYEGDICQRLCVALPLLELNGLGEYCRGCPSKEGCRSEGPDATICSVW